MAGKQCRLWDPAEPQEIVSALVDALREPAAQPMPWRQGWNAVGFKIEFLDDSTNEFSECMTVDCEDTLAVAEAMARAYATIAKAVHKADGYQIRDMDAAGRIVCLEHFTVQEPRVEKP
jgi:hypothetical protein